MNQDLRPRKREEFLVITLARYTWVNPIPLVLVVILLILVFSAVQIGLTADAAYQIGVSSYG